MTGACRRPEGAGSLLRDERYGTREAIELLAVCLVLNLQIYLEFIFGQPLRPGPLVPNRRALATLQIESGSRTAGPSHRFGSPKRMLGKGRPCAGASGSQRIAVPLATGHMMDSWARLAGATARAAAGGTPRRCSAAAGVLGTLIRVP